MAKQDLKDMRRGVTYNMTYTHYEAMTGGTFYFTVKADKFDSSLDDSTAVIPPKVITSFTNAGLTASWQLTDSDTQIDPGTYYYDQVFENSSGESLPPLWEGKFIITGKVTNENV